MTKYFLIAALTLVQFSCKKSDGSTASQEATELSNLKPYTELKQELKSFKGTTRDKQERFFSFIASDVPKYWIGTKWSFNGMTREPQNGTIACGYFVTTVLDDFGIALQRVHLAQQASSVMINTLCESKSIKHFSKIEQLEQHLTKQSQNEIFIVGLDYHTGFIIKDANDLYFMHSNYIEKEGVVKEKLLSSKALLSSKSFMIGSISQKKDNFKS